MKLIITNLDGMVNAVREMLTTEKAVVDILPTTDIHYVTETQLAETIALLEFAADNRKPDNFAQVSPRAVLVALAVLKAVQA